MGGCGAIYPVVDIGIEKVRDSDGFAPGGVAIIPASQENIIIWEE